MRWDEVQPRRLRSHTGSTPYVDPSKVAVLVTPSMRHARVWCSDRGLPDPIRLPKLGDPRPPMVVTNMDNVQRIRGVEFPADAELVVVDRYRCKGGVIEEAEHHFYTAKTRGHVASRRGATRTVIPRGETEPSY